MYALSETLKGLTINSAINNSTYYNSDKDDAEGDQKSDQLVDTHTSDGKKRKVTDNDTTNVNPPQKLWINRTIPATLLLINPRITDGDVAGRGTTHVAQTPASKVIVVDTACGGA